MPERKPEQKHTRESIAKTAKQLRDGGMLRNLSQDEATRRVRQAIRKTTSTREG